MYNLSILQLELKKLGILPKDHQQDYEKTAFYVSVASFEEKWIEKMFIFLYFLVYEQIYRFLSKRSLGSSKNFLHSVKNCLLLF